MAVPAGPWSLPVVLSILSLPGVVICLLLSSFRTIPRRVPSRRTCGSRWAGNRIGVRTVLHVAGDDVWPGVVWRIVGVSEPPRVRWRLRCFGLRHDYSVILAC